MQGVTVQDVKTTFKGNQKKKEKKKERVKKNPQTPPSNISLLIFPEKKKKGKDPFGTLC